MAPADSSMILERDTELGQLRQLLDDLDSSGGRVVLVRGDAGIGKSVLISQFVAEVEDRVHVLFGECDDLLTPQPLGPIWDMAREESSISAPLSQGDRRAVMEALLDLLYRRLRPTVLVVEDTQWADEVTLDVIRFLGRRIGRTNGLLILTYRDGEVDTVHPLRQVIGELPPQNLVRIHLDHLSTQAVASMVEDTELDLDEVVALTGGNPLFVTEVLASGVEKVPASIQDSVLARAAKLSSEGRRVLDLVSVIPGAAERSVIEEILAPTQEEMTECERQGLLRVKDETVFFHHELARRAVEGSLSAADRRRLNHQVLAEISGRADPSRLVHHARKADDVESIIEVAPKAARAAMAVESHREAADLFRTLEPYLDRIAQADRAAILDDWARTEFYLNDIEAVDILARAIDLHRSAGSDRALARALTFAVRLNEVIGRPQAAEACSVEAVAILEAYPPDADLAFAVSQRAWLSFIRGDGVRAVELADRAISIAEAVGDELTIIHSLNTKASVLCRRGDPTGFEMLEECHRRAVEGGYSFEETRALGNMASVAADLREVERAGDLAQRGRETAARHQHPGLEAFAQAQFAWVLQWRGDWVAAEDVATEVLASYPNVEMLASCVLGTLQARWGRPEARTTLDRAWSLAEASAEIQHLVLAAFALAEYMWLTGEDDPDLIERFRELLEERARLASTWSAGSLAFWLWKLGHLSTIPDGIAEPYQLLMGGKPIEAAAIWEAKGIPYEQALALMHGGETEQVRALRMLEGLGASVTADRVRRALLDKGVRVPRGKSRSTRNHAAGLTARQAEVLELLADGLTSPQIADRLFVSHRTAESHVAAILMKLDVTTRDAAIDAARDRGLLTTP